MKYKLGLIMLAISIIISSPCYAAPLATPSDATPSNAIEIKEDDEDFELVNDLELEQYDFDYETFINNVEATYTVVVPAKVQLGATSDGTWSAVYKVGVAAFNNGNVGISVKPTSKIISLKSIGKKDISAHIEQNITEFSSDIQEADGNIWVDDYDLSAGKWSGVFSFDVKVKEIGLEVVSETDVATSSNATPSNAKEG